MGKVFAVTFIPKDNTYTTREVAKVAEAQAIAVQPLPDGSFLIGTSPTAARMRAPIGICSPLSPSG